MAEDFQPNNPVTTQKGSSNKKPKPSTSSKKDKWCMWHETNTHDSSECSVLLKMKGADGRSSDKKPQFKNKTWQCKSEEAKGYSKKELVAIAKKAGKEAIRKATKELNAMAKRAVEEDSSDDSDDDSSMHSLNALEMSMKKVDEQLKDFDFMDVQSNGEISC